MLKMIKLLIVFTAATHAMGSDGGEFCEGFFEEFFDKAPPLTKELADVNNQAIQAIEENNIAQLMILAADPNNASLYNEWMTKAIRDSKADVVKNLLTDLFVRETLLSEPYTSKIPGTRFGKKYNIIKNINSYINSISVYFSKHNQIFNDRIDHLLLKLPTEEFKEKFENKYEGIAKLAKNGKEISENLINYYKDKWDLIEPILEEMTVSSYSEKKLLVIYI